MTNTSAAFEAWAKTQETGYHLVRNPNYTECRYQTMRTQHAFEGFLGGMRFAAPVAPDLAGEREAFEQFKISRGTPPERLNKSRDGRYYVGEMNVEWQYVSDFLASRPQVSKADAKDAARYQWMRFTFIDDESMWPDDVADAKTGDQLDTAIDAAMAKEAQP